MSIGNFGPQAVAALLAFLISLTLELYPPAQKWWSEFLYKRLAWLVGCVGVSFVWVGLAYVGAPVGLVVPGPYIWDGLFLSVSTAGLAYLLGQIAYGVNPAVTVRKEKERQEAELADLLQSD